VLVRQVLGAIAQFDKATVVAKLKAARDRKREQEGKCGGRKSYAERNPEMVKLARELHRPEQERRPVSLREVAAGLADRGFMTPSGRTYSASAVASMIGSAA
jgi:DNA invertase Pin-like site-specific DNA recombinase